MPRAILVPPADCFNLINFPAGVTFAFFGVSYSSVYLNSNGLLSFGAQNIAYTSQSFPISGTPAVAPLWVICARMLVQRLHPPASSLPQLG